VCVKSTEERFAEIVAEVEGRVEEQKGRYPWPQLPINNEMLAVLRSVQMKLARLQEENADKSRAIEYLRKRG
jgi:hypothetical protein